MVNGICELVSWVNGIRWRQCPELTPDAIGLLDQHIALMRSIVRQVMLEAGVPLSEAHGVVLTPSHNMEEYQAVLETLFDQVDFVNAGAREPIIMTIAANEVWGLDRDLSRFANPWSPLVELFSRGYPVSYEDAPDMAEVTLIVGLKDGVRRFLYDSTKAGQAG